MGARIAIVKPDWGIRGGFELVIERVARRLGDDGHRVDTMSLPVIDSPSSAFGTELDSALRDFSAFTQYVAMLDAFEQLDTHRADLVISTQPPSFATPARRHLSIFYHHARVFYDLGEVARRAQMVPADELDACTPVVRQLDHPRMERVDHYLAGSPTVRRRLARFNGLDDNVDLFLAGTSVAPSDTSDVDGTHVLCVSRHEFPKRTELFVHAMALLPQRRGVSVGSGGRLGWVQSLASRLGSQDDPAAVDSESLWCWPAPWMEPRADPAGANLHFAGRVDDDELDRLYRTAACVVAPALDEDYGLTALEAMRYGKPVVVCADGGGLVDLVEHEVTGLVVEPTGPAIAAAVDRLADDDELRRRLGANGREVAALYSWERAFGQVRDGIDKALAA